MKAIERKSQSMVRKFTTEYLVVSLIPLLLFFIYTVTGAYFAERHVADLIQRSSSELSEDARKLLEALGQKVIQSKAKDVAKQVEIFVRYNPGADMADLQNSSYFQDIAMQFVGETGYTCLYEAGSGIMRVHPNRELVDRDMAFLAQKLPSWWAIFEPTLAGKEVSGYYDWLDANGAHRQKYMTMTPVGVPFHGRTLMVAATTYIDEFSAPIVAMGKKTETAIAGYRHYFAGQVLWAGAVVVLTLMATFAGVYLLGRRSALRYMQPIVELAGAAKRFGKGQWEFEDDDRIHERDDEIGELAAAFKRMRSQVKALFQDLENRLAELNTTQAALERSESHYRSLFDGLPVGLYRTTPDGRILDANPVLISMLGYPDKETFLARRADEMYADPGVRALWKQVVEHHEKGGVFDLQMRRYDDSLLWVENHSIAVRDAEGAVRYYEGSLKDITARKEAEAALQRSEENYRTLYVEAKRAEELYRSLLHSSADAIVIYDLQGRVKYLSPVFTKLFGWDLADMEGKKIPFVPDSEKDTTFRYIKALTEHGTPCHGFETKRYTRDGRVIDVSISASRFEDHDGQPAGMLVILRDISERKKLEEQLYLVQRMEAIGTLAGGIAHDFNNLMMGIQGNVSLMLAGTDAADTRSRHLKNIEQLIQSGSKLTRQLLGYARKGQYELKAVDLNPVVRDSVETFGRTRKEIRIHLDLSPGEVVADVDRSQIEQVLFNLYVNAADAMARGGELYIRSALVDHAEMRNKPYTPLPGTYVMIQVSDTGVGMDAETQKRIFDPFFTTKEIGRGTGLGLASAYGIIKAHGGYIEVESEKGKGAAFRIYLRRSTRPIDRPPRRITDKVQRGEGRILLVDDEAMVLEVGVQLLQRLGYEVLAASSGSEALSVYRDAEAPIDLVILDLIMPGTGGGVAYDELKKIDPDVKVLLSSGYSIDGQAMEILKRGCDGFIQKPYTMEALSLKINEILRNS